MASDVTLFHFEDGRESFEDLGKPNGATHWSDENLRQALGYQSKEGFQRAMTRAKQACLSLGFEVEDHFVRQSDGTQLVTRFGCYLVAMNGDPRKVQVAAAQAYFATIAATFQSSLEHADAIDRILIREEVTDGQKSLASTAKAHGVRNYSFFQNKGYLGLYNMSLDRIRRYKGLEKSEKLIDRMGKAELAAHLFRITQTDEKIKRETIRGQFPLETAAFEVGRKVRNTMRELGGTPPEDLPPAEDISSVRRKVKGTSKTFKQLDKAKQSRKRPPRNKE